ncbi:MAG: hypothetical protein Q7T50_00340 [Candidatus Magasanikbacteria bacterium]|nr:hypothetical protein [Candidatus Magasanikbacteria bacterium]
MNLNCPSGSFLFGKMKKFLVSILIILGLTIIAGVSSKAEAVYVNGYYRSNGTYVQPYYRSAPNGLRYDNYSYKPNQPRYNSSYYSCCRSSNWYTPSYTWQNDYYSGYNSYRYRNYGY